MCTTPGMGRDANIAALKAGQVLGGFFSRPNVEWDVPALLHWSVEGARLELLESHESWPLDRGERAYTVHGHIESLEVTLVDAWTQSVAMGDVVHVNRN